MMDLTLDMKLADHPLYDDVEGLQREKEELFRQSDQANGHSFSLFYVLS